MKKTILFILVFMLALVLVELGQAATISVGSGASYDFDSIQAGIDTTSDGDTVLVASGEYVITEPIKFRGKAITVRSEAGLDKTFVRMGTPANSNRGSVVIFESNETIASVLDGFTITGGTGSWRQNALQGGGIFFNASSGTVENCAIVQNNVDGGGGGVMCWESPKVNLSNCIISGNSASGSGGGVFCRNDSSMTMTNCIVRGNAAKGTVSFVNGYGGGIVCHVNSSMTINNCTITGNSAGVSSGVLFCAQDSSVNMTDCIMTNNTTQGWGGAILCWHAATTLTNCVIASNTAVKNHGGLIIEYTDSSLIITNCTIWGNSAGGIESGVACIFGASAMIRNCIIGGNTVAGGSGIYLESSPSILNVTYSNVAGGQTGVITRAGTTLKWGEGNIDADPFFADPSNGDYHLKSEAGRWDSNIRNWIQDDVTSPCIDAGDPMSPIDLEPFPNGGFVNMGAYGGTSEAGKTYFGEPICETIVAGDINGDGHVNRTDLEIMALHWTDDEPLLLP